MSDETDKWITDDSGDNVRVNSFVSAACRVVRRSSVTRFDCMLKGCKHEALDFTCIVDVTTGQNALCYILCNGNKRFLRYFFRKMCERRRTQRQAGRRLDRMDWKGTNREGHNAFSLAAYRGFLIEAWELHCCGGNGLLQQGEAEDKEECDGRPIPLTLPVLGMKWDRLPPTVKEKFQCPCERVEERRVATTAVLSSIHCCNKKKEEECKKTAMQTPHPHQASGIIDNEDTYCSNNPFEQCLYDLLQNLLLKAPNAQNNTNLVSPPFRPPSHLFFGVAIGCLGALLYAYHSHSSRDIAAACYVLLVCTMMLSVLKSEIGRVVLSAPPPTQDTSNKKRSTKMRRLRVLPSLCKRLRHAKFNRLGTSLFLSQDKRRRAVVKTSDDGCPYRVVYVEAVRACNDSKWYVGTTCLGRPEGFGMFVNTLLREITLGHAHEGKPHGCAAKYEVRVLDRANPPRLPALPVGGGACWLFCPGGRGGKALRTALLEYCSSEVGAENVYLAYTGDWCMGHVEGEGMQCAWCSAGPARPTAEGGAVPALLTAVYKGTFKRNKRHGFGRCFYVSAPRRIGCVDDDEVMADRQRRYYEGEMRDDAKCGVGFESFPDGRLVVGHYDSNMPNGTALLIETLAPRDRNAAVTPHPTKAGVISVTLDLTGAPPLACERVKKTISDLIDRLQSAPLQPLAVEVEVRRVERVGEEGVAVRRECGLLTYAGEWKRGIFQGEGFYLWKDGSNYRGSFADNFRDGQGVMVYGGGEEKTRVYDGEWKRGNRVDLCQPGNMAPSTQ